MIRKCKDLISKYEQIVRYLIVGGMTTVFSCIIFYGSTWIFLDGEDAVELQIANVMQWILSTIFAYGMNRRFVFFSQETKIGKELVKFTASRFVTLAMDMIIMFVGASLLHWYYGGVKIFSIVVVVITNYFFSKVLVFKRKTI